MKYLFALCILAVGLGLNTAQAQKIPQENKTIFSEEALNQKVLTLDNESIELREVFEQNKGEIIVLDIWATWCKDCIEGLPQLQALQAQNPEVIFVFLSVDRKKNAWKNGIEKYQIAGKHYWFDSGWKNDFNNYIDLNWVPRYLVVNQQGEIAKYYAVKANDPSIQSTLDTLKQERF